MNTLLKKKQIVDKIIDFLFQLDDPSAMGYALEIITKESDKPFNHEVGF